MGIKMFGNSECGCSSVSDQVKKLEQKVRELEGLPNPNPRNFRIGVFESQGPYMAVRVKYPDCKNYEGDKILAFKGLNINKLMNARFIDPHFCDSGKHPSPIARFEPTNEGWRMARKFIRMLDEQDD